MWKPVVSALAASGALAVATAGLFGVSAAAGQSPVTVHEWGTFTTVAGEDGRAQEWLPLSGPTDLPCFVETFKNGLFKYLPGLPARTYGPLLDYQGARTGLRGTVRMETPVIYFYADRPADLEVNVSFPRGLFTEWYPKAVVRQAQTWANVLRAPGVPTAEIAWRKVSVRPDAPQVFPGTDTPSHYYAARNTDAAPLQVNGQVEKFLFYRGVGGFPVPVAVRAESARTLTIRTLGGDSLPAVVVFTNDAGRIGYGVYRAPDREVTVDRPALGALGESTRRLAALQRELASLLVAEGLFQKEADAMVETWRDTWFEDGTRVFYVVPKPAVDAMLPLAVKPQPAAVSRVFVGRMDVITVDEVQNVRAAIARGDREPLASHGRVLGVIGERILEATTSGSERTRVTAVLDEAFRAFADETTRCD